MIFNEQQKKLIEQCFIDQTFLMEKDYEFVFNHLTAWDKDRVIELFCESCHTEQAESFECIHCGYVKEV